MENGYIKLWRKFGETSFYRNSHCVHLAIHLLLECNHKPIRVIIRREEHTIDRGQMFTSLADLSLATGITMRSIRTSLDILNNVGFLTSKPTSKGRIISIAKYGDYQDKPTSELTSKRQSDDKQTTSLSYKKNDKNVKNTTITPTHMSLPEFINPETWQSYLDMRKAKKAKATERAQELIVKKLCTLKEQGQEPNAILEQSIRSNWTDVYPLKGIENAPQGNLNANSTILTDLEREVLLDYKAGRGIQGTDAEYIEHNAREQKPHLASLIAALTTREAIAQHLNEYSTMLASKGITGWTLKSAAKAAWEVRK